MENRQKRYEVFPLMTVQSKCTKIKQWFYSKDAFWGDYAIIYQKHFFGQKLTFQSTWRKKP